jgi:hypothetical protein
MKLLTEDAQLVCNHETGLVTNKMSQNLVRIQGRRILVGSDPVGCAIKGCSNANPPGGIKPCTTTLAVQSGLSKFVRVNGQPVCLETVTGLTDGTPPSTVQYKVRTIGQSFVDSEG